jgi:FkbM family methyltransferase
LNGRWIWLPRQRWQSFRVVYEEPLLAPLERELRGAGGFLDVGAHHGEWTLWAHQSFPRLRILAVEPSDAALTLQELLRVNHADRRVQVLRTCLSTHGDGLVFHDSGDVNSGVSKEWAQARQLPVRSYPSPSITLANLLGLMRAETAAGDPLVCKIDIEGHEEAVFDDRTVLEDRAVRYFVEVHNCADVETSVVYRRAREAGREVEVLGRCYSPHVTISF